MNKAPTFFYHSEEKNMPGKQRIFWFSVFVILAVSKPFPVLGATIPSMRIQYKLDPFTRLIHVSYEVPETIPSTIHTKYFGSKVR